MTNLRYINRDGKMILQQQRQAPGVYAEWTDVPIVEEKKMTLEEKLRNVTKKAEDGHVLKDITDEAKKAVIELVEEWWEGMRNPDDLIDRIKNL